MIWNPSEGIDLGFFTVRYYSLMFVIAFGLGWYIMKHIYNKENESIDKLDTLFIWTVIATLLGARLGQVFFYDWEYFKNNPSEILLPFKFEPQFEFTGFRGLASHGAAIAIIITMYFYSKKIIKRPILWVLDRVVIPVACGAVFVRIGNFFNSEIVGKVTDSSFGIRFVRDYYSSKEVVNATKINNVNEAYDALVHNPQYAALLDKVPAKHPTQLYEAGLYVFVFLLLFFLYWKTKTAEKQGLLFGYFLILLWSVRFVVEYVKESQGGIEESFGLFSTGQWLSIPFILVGIYYVFMAEKPIEDDL
ncbi:prolipoprotein diacylglyceryl transferase [Flavobacterium sp. IMCC34852]|uniref:Phosphatidylglycerol--prolipoprotein diacylglyceryl transferase n=1 Tax=Flavobacterium rivulicola TaxID=2732161 RepID=A0A7Y3R8B5_9FLAO|nr:prolipoprotein diacylglyceryl transferase [Flavobacterium sp. IMCC34852]NNT71391.1 prolipoprotein diacylglyceryl transferase [Flavobacterium sp. IMCC34852]